MVHLLENKLVIEIKVHGKEAACEQLQQYNEALLNVLAQQKEDMLNNEDLYWIVDLLRFMQLQPDQMKIGKAN